MSQDDMRRYSYCNLVSPLVYSKVYKTPDVPRVVLNKLAQRGYRVVSSAGVGQTCIWTLYKEEGTA